MSAASQTAAEKRLSFLRRASQDFLNAKLDKTYPKLKLEDLTRNYPLLEDVYKLDSTSYKKLFPTLLSLSMSINSVKRKIRFI